MPVILTIILLVIIFAIFVMITYNSLVSARNNVHNAWSQIDVELQRRFDLIPNLVETVKGYMNHEESVLTKVTELRSSWGNASSISEKAKLENELTSTLSAISVVAENYPDLKASEQYLNLQKNLSKIESELQAARRIYNMEVTNYNTAINVVPKNIVANMFGFKEEDLFEIEDSKRENIKVNFEE